MRDIKFRAWLTKEKRFTTIFEMPFLDIDEGALFRYDRVSGNGEICDYKDDEYILSQFTGLKDCEGVEIYEGDILQYGLCVEVVFYEPTMGRFMTELKKCNDESEIGEISSLSPYYTDNYEVIGNIFENTELIEDKK